MASTTSSTALKLIIEKGPRKGETLEYNPRSTVRIGRLVRGNNLQIKDSGISSKHLSIEFHLDSGKWLITDLESSNGTLLNSSQLKPLSPFELCNGDEIKVGELTSIRVEIVEISGEINTRRNTRRQVALKSGIDEESANLGKDGSVRVRVRDLKEENVEMGVENGLELERENKRVRGRGRGVKIVSVLEGGVGDNESEVGKNDEDVESVKAKRGLGTGARRTRSSKREKDGFSGQGETLPPRRTRSSKNVEDVALLEMVPETEGMNVGNCKGVENIGLVENKKTRGRRGRKKKAEAECLDDIQNALLEDKVIREVLEVEDPEQVGGVVDLGEQPCEEPINEIAQKNVLEEKTSGEALEVEVPEQVGAVEDTIEQHCEEVISDIAQQSVLEEKMHMEVSDLEASEQAGVAVNTGEQHGEESMCGSVEQKERVNSASHLEQPCDVMEHNVVLEDLRVDKSESKEASKQLETDDDSREEDQEVDDVPNLETMTLGEWFDYLEVYLPKHIHGVTDEIIADMRKRAKQFNDFMLQQQNEKGKLPLAT